MGGRAGEMQGFWGKSTQKPQVSIKSQTEVMAKKLKKGRKWGGKGGSGGGRGEEMGRCEVSGGRSIRKPQVSIKSQTGVMSKKNF